MPSLRRDLIHNGARTNAYAPAPPSGGWHDPTDRHLKSPDFFDAERFPTIGFRSTGIEGRPRNEGDRFKVTGDLTIRETTLQVVLDCVFDGRGNDPWGKQRAGFSASTEIDRRDWGLRWNHAIETGGVLVANRVRIEIEVQLVKDE